MSNGKKVILKDLFRIKQDAERAGQEFAPFPIIPDMRYYKPISEFSEDLGNTKKVSSRASLKDEEYSYDSPYTPEYAIVLEMTKKCFIHEKDIDSYHKPIRERIKKIIKYGRADLRILLSKLIGRASNKKSFLKGAIIRLSIIVCGILMIPVLVFLLPLYIVLIGRFPLNALSDKILHTIKVEFDKVGMLVKKSK